MPQAYPAKILVIEDNEADVRLMQEALSERYPAPIEITAVDTGDAAVEILKTDAQFDLVILDLNLPKLDGYEVLQQSTSVGIPIIVFSSSWNEDDARRTLAFGAREFVRKPSSYEEYANAVCRMVQRWNGTKVTRTSCP